MKRIMKILTAYAAVGCIATSLGAQTPDTVTFTLQQITVTENFPDARFSPLRLDRIDRTEIDRRATGMTFPEILGGIAGVYATSETGNYGDARMNIRGFKQENIAVMLNGIPISGLTSSSMYWNNWLGLTDATYAVQLQKGVGGSMFADNSVGGTVNIVTVRPDDYAAGSAGLSVTDYGLFKIHGSASSGRLRNGWALNATTSYTWGNNYVAATPVSVFAYMLCGSRQLDRHNRVILTALGSPERHGQRSIRLSADEVAEHGVRYNKGWGWRDGERYNVSLNNYFKPYFTAQHIYDGDRTKITTSAYLAVASGGGRWNESKGAPLTSFMTADGQVDFDAATSLNTASTNGSQVILSDYMAGHTQAGALSKQEFRLSERLTLETGEHYQFYSTWEREEIIDLLGGDYWYEEWGDNYQKQVGDGVRTRNGKRVHHATVYASAKYQTRRLNLTAGLSLIHAEAQRWDSYNYTENIWSDPARGTGYTAKIGALWRNSTRSTIYANIAAYSRVPYTGVWFSSGSNAVNHDVSNEENYIGEAGYRFAVEDFRFEATAYYALWHNKSLLSNPYKPTDGDTYKYMITGLDARHAGIEMEGSWQPTEHIAAEFSVAVADWRWLNDVEATIYDDYTSRPVTTVAVYCKALPVGDAPQTQAIARVRYTPSDDIAVTIEADYIRRMYADFEPQTRTSPDDRALPYRIPDRVTFNATASWRWFTVGVDNIFDTRYITRGKDGADHTADSFRGYWGFGRNFSLSVRIPF